MAPPVGRRASAVKPSHEPSRSRRSLSRREAASASSADVIAKIAASGGLEASLRHMLWPRLLGLAEWLSPFDTPPYDATRLSELDEEFDALLERVSTVNSSLVSTIAADVPRTDSTLTMEQCNALRDLLLAFCVVEPSWGCACRAASPYGPACPAPAPLRRLRPRVRLCRPQQTSRG